MRRWICIVVLLLSPAALGLDSRANVDKAIELIEAGEHGLARAYLAPALIDPRLSPGERSRAYYLRGFSFVAERLPVSAGKDFHRALEFNPQNPGALFALGRLHFYGQGVEQDQALAVSLFEQAAASGNVGARFHLGYALMRGEGVDKDLERARALLAENAESGHAYSMLQLAASYREPIADEPDPRQALEWYQAAVEAGDASGYLSIGFMHSNGELGDKNIEEAVANFRRAADLGLPAAYLSLGHSHLTGVGVEQDYVKARELYEHAAAAEVPGSFVGLGHIYEAGLGVAADPAKAREWYREGAKRGDMNALMRITYLLLNEESPEARVDAMHWLRQAVDQGSAQAHNDYAWLLATSRRDDLRNGTLAISHAKQAVAKEKKPAYLDTLAAAYAENGQFADAIAVQQEALALVSDEDVDLRKELEAHLTRYQSSEPWRE